MRYYTHKTPALIKYFYSGLVWNLPARDKTIYLTFDDGPHPEATSHVLDELKKFKAHATFFCVGANITRYPDLACRIHEENHAMGNHSYHHLNGWRTAHGEYVRNVTMCEAEIRRICGRGLSIFRPPYGRITRTQIKSLKPDYRIIMWDYLIGDFDRDLKPEKAVAKAIRHIRPGSIVIFHDSVKAKSNLFYILPRYLEKLYSSGYSCKAITAEAFENT